MKKLAYILVGVIGIAIVIIGFNFKSAINEKQAEQQQVTLKMKEEIQAIVYNAQEGIIRNFFGVIGETTLEEVKDHLGVAESIVEEDIGYYIDYPVHSLKIGLQSDLVFDVHYAGTTVQKIRYEDIIHQLGKPDEQEEYEDTLHAKFGLVYKVSPAYTLKWIVARPTEQSPNPKVEHIEVWTDIETAQDKLLKEMTLDEKIGQLVIAGIDGTTINEVSQQLIEQYHIGGVIFYANNAETAVQTRALVNELKVANEVNRIPLFISIDQEGGRVARLPKEIEPVPAAAVIGVVQ